jgi:hypothetical protein
MGYFAIGNMLLKIKRSRLPRPVTAAPIIVAFAIIAIVLATYGNIRLHPEYLVIFIQYFVPALLFLFAMMYRSKILQFLLTIITSLFDEIHKLARFSKIKLTRLIHRIESQEFVFFSKADDISGLNKVLIYVSENETTTRLRIVTVIPEGKQISEEFMSDLKVLDRIYPEIHIEFITLHGTFGPELINKLSLEWKIPKNYMFISSFGHDFLYQISELGGVRLIL